MKSRANDNQSTSRGKEWTVEVRFDDETVPAFDFDVWLADLLFAYWLNQKNKDNAEEIR